MRTLGALEVSVGTSLAFETNLQRSFFEVDTLLINLRTIVRNVIQAYDAEDGDKFNALAVSNAAVEDIKLIASAIHGVERQKPLEFVIYCPTYASLSKLFPQASLKVPTSDKQKQEATVVDAAIKLIKKKLGDAVISTDCNFPKFNGVGYVLTHHVVDLTLTNSQTRLSLLESYTGVIKPHTLWFTKLTGGKELFNMPFNRLTIQIFGDNSINFRSSSLKIKNLLLDVAAKGKWNSGSTLEKVRGSINIFTTGFDRTGLLSLLN